jgi:hypothetical protein
MRNKILNRAAKKWLGSAFRQPVFPTALASCLLAAGAAYGASITYDFNTDPTATLNFGGTLWDGTTTSHTGSSAWIQTGGAGPVGNTTNGPVKGVAGDGYLQITFATGACGSSPVAFSSYLSGCVLFDDFDKGLVVAGFTFECDLRIGNGNPNPADGFSINYARGNDPVLVAINAGDTFPEMNNTGPSLNGGQFSDNGNGGDISLMEEGTSTGLAVGFDMWDSGNYTIPPAAPAIGLVAPGITHDGIGLDIRVDNTLLTTISMPNGTTQTTSDQRGNALVASDPNGNTAPTDPLSIETGPYNGTGCATNLSWVHLKVVLDTNGVLNVFWKNKQILTNFTTAYFPSPGRLILASRVGGNTANIAVDNVQITTIPALEALVGPATGFADGFSVQVGDSGQSVLDTNQPIALTLNGKSVTPTSVDKVGGTTTVIYHAGFPNILGSGSTNNWTLNAKDTLGNAIASGPRTFVAPTYITVPGAFAVTGVDTNKAGFRLQMWQGSGSTTHNYWANEQIAGLHGTNAANLAGFNDSGYLDYTTYLNFNITPSSVTGGGEQGDFRTNNGYADVQFPGLPGAVGNGTDSSSLEVLCFLQFAQPGLYEMGVNSDDGFAVTTGLTPKDRFAPVLGTYDGGRGSSDSRFSIVITNAGIYPMRLLWYNGGGGANLEWFTVNNGVRYLVNDPSPTNTTGIKAFYSGPAQAAYVSQINPYDGQSGARPDQVLAQITDGSSTVNQGSVKLTVSGNGLTSPAAVVSKAGSVTTAKISFSTFLDSGSNYTATLVWSDNATPANNHSNTWAFTVMNYSSGATLDASLMVPVSSLDKTQPGLNLMVSQLDSSIVLSTGGMNNTADENNALLAGTYFPWFGSNVADLASASAVNGPAYTNNNYIWTNAIDFNDTGSAGDFTFDYMGPGIPGLTGNANNFARGFDCWLVFPTAGFFVMGVNSDDGFRLSESAGLLRQVLHVTGTGINTDVAAVVSHNKYNNGGFGIFPPLTPISGQVMYVNSNNYTGGAINLTGKVALVDEGFFGASDAVMCYVAQTNGAIGFLKIRTPANGTPDHMTGGAPGPITIPAMSVIGFGGARDWWLTNGTLTASIGASDHLIVNADEVGKGMGHVDAPFFVPTAGAYPMHLTYYQGGGGAGLEWTLVNAGIAADGSRSLINDLTDTNSLVAYLPTAAKATSRPTLSVGLQGGKVVITFTGTLTSSTTVNGTYAPVAGAASPYTVPSTTGAGFYKTHN